MSNSLSQIQNKFNENFWSSHFNAQSKCVINDKDKLVPVSQKGGGDFVKVVTPLANSGLAQSDSIVRQKRKRKSGQKQTVAKKRKVTKKTKVQRKKKTQPKKKKSATKKKATKTKKKKTTKKKTGKKNRRSSSTKRR